jgi:hypothetical protein
MDIATIVDLVLAVLGLEIVVLALAGRRFARLPGLKILWPNLAAGLCLVLALRCAVHESGWPAVAAFLALAGVAHVLDLRGRSRP